MNAADKEALLNQLKEQLKTTTDVKSMTHLLNRIKAIKNGEDDPGALNDTKSGTASIRIAKAKDSAEAAIDTAKENAEKKLEQEKIEAQAQARKELVAAQKAKVDAEEQAEK